MLCEVNTVNINHLDLSGNLRVTNPLSSKKGKKHSPSFSGCILTQDNRGRDVYKINLPNAPKGTKVELVAMTKDNNGNYSVHQNSVSKELPGGFGYLEVKADDFNLKSSNAVLGYKFVVNGKQYNDKSVVGDKGYNIAVPVWAANSTAPKVIEHFLIDAFNVPKENLNVRRNHFNVLGTTLNSTNEMVPKMAEAGITEFLSTPVFGQDNISSHGYWTTNPYQITNNLGDITDFKNLMINLYNHGMRWIADGAFVNEGVEGIHIKDIQNWGAKSPLLNMFETKDVQDIPPRYGILSKNPEVDKHTHIQLVNAPYRIIFEKGEDGVYYEKAIKHSHVNPSYPTYIQVFDDRLASEEQMNGNKTFNVYDKKETGDSYDIANYRDSVQAANFRVTPREVEANYHKYKEARHHDKDSQFKNYLTRWTNKEIVTSNKDGGISMWVGNSDISKKKFITAESTIAALPPERRAAARAAQYQVQDDTVQIGKFWAYEVARTLTEYTAKELSDKVKNQGKTYKEAVEELISEKKIPKRAETILEQTDNKPSALDNILKMNAYGTERRYHLRQQKMPETIADGLMSYPFDAIEFSPDLVSVFSYPYIKNMAVTEDTVGKSRYDMFKMGDAYYNMMPEDYRALYKKMDNVIASDLSAKAFNILSKLEQSTGQKLLEGKELTTQGREIYSMIAPDVAKFLVVSALVPSIEPNYANKNNLEYNTKNLNKVDLNALNLQYETTPEKTADKLINMIKTGVDKISEDKMNKFVAHLSQRLDGIDSDAVNVAKLIVEKTESGLNFRIDASKDVGDSDSVEDGAFSDAENKQRVMNFWNKFNSGFREYNPAGSSFGELTNWPSSIFAEFMLRTGFTTISDYNYFYSMLPGLYGQNDEGTFHGNIASKFSDRAYTNKGEIGYFDSATAEGLNFSHRFVGNHDKPRILHLFATNVGVLNTDRAKAVADAFEQRGFANSSEFNSLPDSFKSSMRDALNNLKDGRYHKDGVEKPFDAEDFGARPFDYNIDYIINEAAEINSDFKNYIEAPENQPKVAKLKANILQAVLAPALEKYRALWFAMNALPGAPTNYAGDELAMTGWETPCKNEKQQNRNPLRWDRLDDDNYAFIKDFKRKLDDISKVRTLDAASALSNGAIIHLYDQQIKGGGKALALYRYNDKTDAICILNNDYFSADNNSTGKESYLDYIDLGNLPFGLQKGTIYVDALNKNNKFKVTDDYKIEKINDKGDTEGEIYLGNAGLILLRESDFKNKKFSFKGRIENANVKLANTKYNFSYMNK